MTSRTLGKLMIMTLAVANMAGPQSAWASHKRASPASSPQAQEVYSATDDSDEHPSGSKPVPLAIRMPQPVMADAPAAATGKKKKDRKKAAPKAVAKALPKKIKNRPVVADAAPRNPEPLVTPVTAASTIPGVQILPLAQPKAQEQAAYDSVPSGQTEPLLERLRIVEEIVRKHGRAYDYRIHTIKELETILSSLDKRIENGGSDSDSDAARPAAAEPEAAQPSDWRTSPDLGEAIRPLPRSFAGRY